MRKRICAITIIVAVILSLCNFSFAEEQEKSMSDQFMQLINYNQGYDGVDDEKTLEIIGFLRKLGLVFDLDYGKYDMNRQVSRAEMAAMVTKMMGETPVVSDEDTGFSDVFSNHWAAGYIRKAADLGLMNGDGQTGRFRPEDPILGDEAIKIFICALGYEKYAVSKGAYPEGYRAIARSLSLNDLNDYHANPCSLLSVLKMIYNVFNTPVLLKTFKNGNVEYYADEEETFLYNILHIKKCKGQITETEISALGGKSSLGIGRVRINDDIYDVGNTNAKAMLGYQVVYYYQENKFTDTNTLIYVKADMKETLVIDSKDLISYNDYVYKYSIKNTTKIKKLESNTSFIYNGKAYSSYENMVPKSGFVVIISGTESMVVLIYDLQNCVVANINMADGMIYGQIGTSSLIGGDDVTFDLMQTDGTYVPIEAIPIDSTITFYKSDDGKYYNGYFCTSKFTGTVDEVLKDDSNCDEYTINGNRYVSSPVNTNKYIVGRNYTFYKNIADEIVYAKETKPIAGYQYGYLLRAGSGECKNASFKIFTQTAQMMTLTAAKKIKLNGIKYNGDDEDLAKKIPVKNNSIAQLVRFACNDNGEIYEIEFTNETKNQTLEKAGLPTEDECLEKAWSGTADWRRDVRIFPGLLGKLNEQTICFAIPENLNNESSFLAQTHWMFTNDESYTVTGYKVNKDSIAADVVVRDITDNYKYRYEGITIISSVGTGVNSDNEVVPFIAGIKGAQEVRYNLRDSEIWERCAYTDSDGNKVYPAKGDIVRLSFDSKNNITDIQYIFDTSEKHMVISNGGFNYGGFNSQTHYVYGRPYDFQENTYLLYLQKEELDERKGGWEYVITSGETYYYVVDLQNNAVYHADSSSIENYLQMGGVSSLIFARTSYVLASDIVVIKE